MATLHWIERPRGAGQWLELVVALLLAAPVNAWSDDPPRAFSSVAGSVRSNTGSVADSTNGSCQPNVVSAVHEIANRSERCCSHEPILVAAACGSIHRATSTTGNRVQDFHKQRDITAARPLALALGAGSTARRRCAKDPMARRFEPVSSRRLAGSSDALERDLLKHVRMKNPVQAAQPTPSNSTSGQHVTPSIPVGESNPCFFASSNVCQAVRAYEPLVSDQNFEGP